MSMGLLENRYRLLHEFRKLNFARKPRSDKKVFSLNLQRWSSLPWAKRSAFGALLSCGVIGQTPANTISANQLTMAGYQEQRSSQSWDSTAYLASLHQAQYAQDKSELLSLIEDCGKKTNFCHPNIKAFADMLEQVKQLPDRLTIAEAINAWINLYIDYDRDNHDTAAKMNGGVTRHTLKQALINRKGLCDEQARLKLFALEIAGFPSDDIRWVYEKEYMFGALTKLAHVVVLVQIGQKHWVLNNQAPYIDSLRISYAQAISLINDASRLEEDAAHLNISGHSLFAGDRKKAYVPYESFSPRGYASYNITLNYKLSDMTVSELAKKAKRSVTDLGTNALAQYDKLMPMMKSALEARHQLDARIIGP